MYFACLEALQNVSKYADADRAWVAIGTEDGELVFRVRDDGRGFDPASTNLGTGIQGIDDRLAALGGRLRIDSSPGAGATIEGRLPVATMVCGRTNGSAEGRKDRTMVAEKVAHPSLEERRRVRQSGADEGPPAEPHRVGAGVGPTRSGRRCSRSRTPIASRTWCRSGTGG